ncbi:MAG: hypothetical protein WDZ94_03915 [Patescibacteria group bacterium]
MKNIEVRTQLGGKFSREDDGIFVLKKQLKSLGVAVTFPEGDNIIGDHNGIPVTFNPNEKDFYQVELEYLASIRDSSLHIVYNNKPDVSGYIGESASLEMLYAIAHNKPIIIMYSPIVLSNTVWDEVREPISRNQNEFFQIRFDLLTPEEVLSIIDRAAQSTPKYKLTSEESEKVFPLILKLMRQYRNR